MFAITIAVRSFVRRTGSLGIVALGFACDSTSDPPPESEPASGVNCESDLELLDGTWEVFPQPDELLGDAGLPAKTHLTTSDELVLWRGRVVASLADGMSQWEILSEPNRPPTIQGVAAAASPTHVLLQGETTITTAPDTERGYVWETNNTLELFERSTQTWTSYDPGEVTDLRIFTLAVWTGSEFLLWGGSNIDPYAPGGEYPFDVLHLDPVSGQLSVSEEGPAPFAYIESELPETFGGHGDAVWTGDELFVWGITPYQDETFQGAYDPVTREWDFEMNAEGPGPRRFAHLVPTPEFLYLVGGIAVDSRLDYLNEIWRYSRGDRTWTQLEIPEHLVVRDGVWSRERLFVFGDCDQDAVFDPQTETWMSLPSLRLPNHAVALSTNQGIFLTQVDQEGGSTGEIYSLLPTPVLDE